MKPQGFHPGLIIKHASLAKVRFAFEVGKLSGSIFRLCRPLFGTFSRCFCCSFSAFSFCFRSCFFNHCRCFFNYFSNWLSCLYNWFFSNGFSACFTASSAAEASSVLNYWEEQGAAFALALGVPLISAANFALSAAVFHGAFGWMPLLLNPCG